MKLPNVWNESFSEYIQTALKHEASKLFHIHQLPEELGLWKKHREELLKKIWKSLGVSIDHSIPLDYHETGTIQMEGYSVKKIYYQSRPDFYVTGNLYVPAGKGPFPAVINVHGHWTQGRLAQNVQARGHSLAKNGYVCLCVDAFGSGERATIHGKYEYHGSMLGGALMNIGETLMGIQIVDNMRGVDLLSSLEYVDPSRIGATGASGGGNQTMWLTAMDDRIKAGMPVVSAGTFQSYIMCPNCVCELLPDGLTYTEESGIFALVAPRALKLCNCLKDTIPSFHPAEMLRSYNEARRVFQLHGSDEKLSYQIFNLTHGYHPEIREAMLGFFDLHLKGIGNGAPRAEIPFESLPEEDVMVFEKGKRPEKVISIAEYCRKKAGEINNAKKEFNAVSLRKNLAEILKIRKPLVLKAVNNYSPIDGWDRLALETECGRMLPLLLRKPVAGNGKFIIIGSCIPKEKLLDASMIKDAMDSDDGVVIIDLWGTGETNKVDNIDLMYVNMPRALLWMGRTLLGEWCRDFAAVESFVRSFCPNVSISLGGYKEAGVAALLSSAMNGSAVSVITEKTPVSMAFNEKPSAEYSNMALLVPDFLKWGDLSLALSLINANIHLINPVTFDGIALDEGAVRNYEKEINDLKGKHKISSKSNISFNLI